MYMRFNEMLDLNPKLTLAEFINLCLKADDDKIYIDIEIVNGSDIENLRVIDSRLIPYYEYKIIGIYEAERIVLLIKKDNEEEERIIYTVDSVVCDYGVFEVYRDNFGKVHKDLKLICNSRHNAILIADIMKKDLKGEKGDD